MQFEQCLATTSCLSAAGHDDTGICLNTSETSPPSPSAPLDTIVDVPCQRSVSKTEVTKKTAEVNGLRPSNEAPVKVWNFQFNILVFLSPLCYLTVGSVNVLSVLADISRIARWYKSTRVAFEL